MKAWTHGQVMLSLDEVQELALEEVSAALQLGDVMSLMVVVDVVGAFGAQLILQFDEEGARQLVACLLGRPVNPLDTWGQLETSALAETGNILASAYLNQITLLTGCRVMPAPPCVVQDFAAGVLEGAIITQAMAGEQILLCRTRFQLRGEPIEWNVFFVPSLELLGALRECALATPAAFD
jgi:chemotaxis protein CheC